jgi:hypothetical protein
LQTQKEITEWNAYFNSVIPDAAALFASERGCHDRLGVAPRRLPIFIRAVERATNIRMGLISFVIRAERIMLCVLTLVAEIDCR